MNNETIGILTALEAEIQGIIELIKERHEERVGPHNFISGYIHGIKVVVAMSCMGKVFAAETTTLLIHKYNIKKLIFIGVAGCLNDTLHLGDVIVSKDLYQHDVDARPLLPRFHLSILNCAAISSDPKLQEIAYSTITTLLPVLKRWKHTPHCYIADIASGDQVITAVEQKSAIKDNLPSIYCVEMEGAAVAQIAATYSIPFVVIRAVSDDAEDFSSFIPFTENIWSQNAKLIIDKLLYNISLLNANS